jgi:regulator of vacuolar morphogenesis
MAPPLEISIPTTSLHSPPDGTKPYTLYNITLRLPLRSFVVQKRYSDFAALHTALTSLVGTPPPTPLPAKSWFRSTVSSADLTEQRRVGLEAYLRAIAEPPDRRWRDTPVWRAFLNLPSASGASVSGVSVEGRIPAIGLRDANLAAACDPATWVDLNKELKRELKAAQAALERRERGTEVGEQLEAEAAARKALVKAGSLMGPLGEGLGIMKESGRLGAGEFNRRKGVLDAARREKDLFDQLAANLARRGTGPRDQGAASESDRAKLMPPRPVGRQLGRPLPETEETRELDNEGVLQRQKLTMQEQDEDLGELAKILHRQNVLARAMHKHIEEDNDMLDHANARADSLQRKLGVGNRRAKNL